MNEEELTGKQALGGIIALAVVIILVGAVCILLEGVGFY